MDEGGEIASAPKQAATRTPNPLGQLSEDHGKIHGDGRIFDCQRRGFNPAFGGAIISASGLRIDYPDMANSHLAVVMEAFLVARDAIFRREYLDDGKGRALQHLISRLTP